MLQKLLHLVFPLVFIGFISACTQSSTYPTAGYAPYNQGYGNYQPQPPLQQMPQAVSHQTQAYVPQAQGNFYPPVPLGQKIKLKALNIKFISSYNPPNRAPNIEHLLLVTPEQVVHKWAENRFSATGTPDRLVRFLIKDASIVEENVITGSCFKSVVQQYTGKVEITIQIVDTEGRVLIETTAQATKKELVDGGASLETREKVWVNLMFDLVKILSARLDGDLSSPSFNEYIER